jgi:hypothetical protein
MVVVQLHGGEVLVKVCQPRSAQDGVNVVADVEEERVTLEGLCVNAEWDAEGCLLA